MSMFTYRFGSSQIKKALVAGCIAGWIVSLSRVAEGGVEINFDDRDMGEIVYRQYQPQGAIFTSVDFNFSTFTTTPVYNGLVAYYHWVVSGERCVEPTRTGTFQLCPYLNFPAMQIQFVRPGTEQPAWTDYVSVQLDAAPDDGGGSNLVHMIAFDPEGRIVGASAVDDNIPCALLSVSGSRINRVIVAMDPLPDGRDLETYDNVYFNTLVPEPASLILLGLGGLFLRRKR